MKKKQKQYRIRESLSRGGRWFFWPEVKHWYGWDHVENHRGGFTCGLTLDDAKKELEEALRPEPAAAVEDRFHAYP